MCYQEEIQRILQQTYWLSVALEVHGPIQQLLIQEVRKHKHSYLEWKQCVDSRGVCIYKESAFPMQIIVNIPVAMDVGFFIIQLGIASPVNMENPKMKMLREEFMSVYYS